MGEAATRPVTVSDLGHCLASSLGPTLTTMLGLAPYFSLELRGWVPYVVSWDRATGRFSRVEGPDAFTTWEEAEASRFLRP